MQLFYPNRPKNIKPVSESEPEPISSRLITWNKAFLKISEFKKKRQILHPMGHLMLVNITSSNITVTQNKRVDISVSQGHEQSQKST